MKLKSTRYAARLQLRKRCNSPAAAKALPRNRDSAASAARHRTQIPSDEAMASKISGKITIVRCKILLKQHFYFAAAKNTCA